MRSPRTTGFRLILIVSCFSFAIETNAFSNDTTIVKGSYFFYAPSTIEDNSMFIEEALNQSSGSLQFVSTLVMEQQSSAYQLEIEVPLAGEKHQISFSLPVKLQSFRESRANARFFDKVGDIQISYRPLLLGKARWCLLAPSVTFILPAENLTNNFSANGCGGEVKIAFTKRLNRSTTTHLNFGGSWVATRSPNGHSDFIPKGATSSKQSASLGAGLVWAVTSNFNLMLEQVFTGSVASQNSTHSQLHSEMTLNPAMRFAMKLGKHQLVPGLGFPLDFSKGAFQGCNAFFYLSVETGN